MKNQTKLEKTPSKQKEQKEQVKDDDNFKTDIVIERSKTKERRILTSLILLVLMVFAGLGVGYYQIFVKPEQLDAIKIQPEEKIESKPEEPPAEEKPVEPAPTTPQNPAPTPSVIEYAVLEGDTWSSIANANGMTSKQLMDYNGSTSEDLQIGQKIKIPKS